MTFKRAFTKVLKATHAWRMKKFPFTPLDWEPIMEVYRELLRPAETL